VLVLLVLKVYGLNSPKHQTFHAQNKRQLKQLIRYLIQFLMH